MADPFESAIELTLNSWVKRWQLLFYYAMQEEEILFLNRTRNTKRKTEFWNAFIPHHVIEVYKADQHAARVFATNIGTDTVHSAGWFIGKYRPIRVKFTRKLKQT